MMNYRKKRFPVALTLLVAFAVFAGMVLCGQAFAARTYSPDGKGYLEYITTDTGHQQPFLHLEGTGYEMGFQHGYLMGEACADVASDEFFIAIGRGYVGMLGPLGPIVEDLLLTEIGSRLGLDLGGTTPADLIIDAFKLIAKNNEKYIPQAYLDEMHGIADGVRAAGIDLDYEDVLLVNVGFDALLSFGYPIASPLLIGSDIAGDLLGDLQLSCNAFVLDGNATVDDSLYLGRDFMFSGPGFTDHPVIFEICGDNGRNRVVSVGVAGIAGVIAAMNEKGIGIGMDMVPSVDCGFGDVGMGCLLTARYVMEEADELSDGVSLIKDSKRGVSWLYALADGRGAERGGVSVETSAHHVFTRDMGWTDISPLEAVFTGRPGVVSQQEDYPDFLLQTNHYIKPDMYFNVPLNYTDRDSLYRYDRMMEIFKDASHPLGGYGTYDFDKAFDYINWMYLTGDQNPGSKVNQSTTLFDLTHLKMKTLCGPTFAQGATEYVLPADPPPPSSFSFKSYHGKYFCAENNGGKTVNANRTAIGDWEKFVMVGTDGKTGNITDGETVTIRTGKNYYFNAKKKTKVLWWYTGGGLDADTTAPQAFKLVNHTHPGGVLRNGDLISLKTVYSTYVVAESDGDALADRTSIGNWEKFNVIFHY